MSNKVNTIALDEFLPYLVARLSDKVTKRTAAIAKNVDGLNLSHWRVLAAVAEAPGRTAQDVVAMTPMDKGIVSRAVKTLLNEKLLVRKASQTDGRIGHLHLTAKGERVYAQLAGDIREVEALMLSALDDDEAATLKRLTKKLMGAFDAIA